jgi:hypothetical protein
MTLSIRPVPIEYVNQIWASVKKFIEESISFAEGEITLDETKYHVISGNWVLYIVTDEENNVHGAVTVAFYNRTDNRVAFITNIGGRLITDKDLFAQFSDLLRQNGATCIEGNVRDSLFRLWTRIGARKKSIAITIPL